MKKPRILSMVDLSECPQVLEPLMQIATVDQLQPNQQVLEDVIGSYQAFLTPLTLRTDQQVLQNAHLLKAVATASTGTDHIDIVEAENRGIAIISLRDDTDFLNSLTATAELAWGLLLSVIRRIPEASQAAKMGVWGRDKYRGHQLSGKTLGVVGYGRLGKMVAEFGRAFRMRVLVNDTRTITTPKEIEKVEFYELLQHSDVVSIHIHLTESNRSLFNRDVIYRMKRGAILINTSRGAILEESALIDALRSGQLAGAGLDVIDGEWRQNLIEHPLIAYSRTHPNLVITPHIGGVTYESQQMAYARTIGKLVDFFQK